MPLSYAIIVPARGGSKRVPNKNIAPLGGKPLLQYTLDLIQNAGLKDHAWVSTEDAAIRALATESDVAVIDRPEELAQDTASTEGVLLHAVDILSHGENPIDWVMTLPPTSPFRTPATIQKFLDEASKAAPDIDCLFAVSERMGRYWRKSADGGMQPLFPGAPSSQQERRKQGLILYEENSAIYMTRVSALRKATEAKKVAAILGAKAVGIAIEDREAADINTPFDWVVAEALLKRE